MNNPYYLVCEDLECVALAHRLIQFTGSVRLLNNHNTLSIPYLYLDKQGLAICSQRFKPLYVHKIYEKMAIRSNRLGTELLIQAIKIKNQFKVTVLDLTAGLARDAMLIALYGYDIVMIEENPLLATVIYYAILNNFLPVNMKLIYANSIDYMRNNSLNYVEVIYLDPMFNYSRYSKAKKEMQLIQDLLQILPSNNNDDREMFLLARALAKKIVVKRNNKQAIFIPDVKPAYSKIGSNIRYDIYINS